LKIYFYFLLIFLFFLQNGIFSFEKNKSLPTLSLRDSEQKFVNVNDIISKPTIFMAFNLACVYCDSEIKELMKIKEKYKDKLEIILINADSLDRKEEVLEKVAKLNCDFLLLFDKNQDYTEGLSFPYTVIVNSQGTILEITTGYNETTKKIIYKVIEKKGFL
jgi:peroxiredoxin